MTERPLATNRCLDVIEVESRAALIGHERPLSQTVGLFLVCVCVCVVLFPLARSTCLSTYAGQRRPRSVPSRRYPMHGQSITA